ncbi:MAG: sel1 repeat family protein [Candidatus Obscuribacterales bacterium]|nr:sel1 repeat family protein [Candidatus Obscuribacterales bacterium]
MKFSPIIILSSILTGCGINSYFFDMTQPAVMGDLSTINPRVFAASEDDVAFWANFRGITHGVTGGLSENGVFNSQRMGSSFSEAKELAKRLHLKEVTDRNDSDARNVCADLAHIAEQFRTGNVAIHFFKSMNKPENFKLKSGRQYDHALYFYDERNSYGYLELSYGTPEEVKIAEEQLEKYMTPVAPPPDLLKKGNSGNADAQYQLGKFFQTNNPMNRGCPLAVRRWYEKAAAQNHPAAQCELAKLHFNGYLVWADSKEGMELIRLSANAGYGESKRILAEQLLATSKQTHPTAKQGAQMNREALALMRQAANSGDESAWLQLGYELPDKTEAEAWLRKAATEAKDKYVVRASSKQLGQTLMSQSRFQDGEKFLIQAAQEGDKDSQMELAQYFNEHHNYAESARWFKAAYENPMNEHTLDFWGNSTAQGLFNQAEVKSKDGDFREAARLYREAYEKNAKDWYPAF